MITGFSKRKKSQCTVDKLRTHLPQSIQQPRETETLKQDMQARTAYHLQQAGDGTVMFCSLH